jgi:Fe2+ or Zn2+ uptake regulation protein
VENECLSKSNTELVKEILQLKEKMLQIERTRVYRNLEFFSEKNGKVFLNRKKLRLII